MRRPTNRRLRTRPLTMCLGPPEAQAQPLPAHAARSGGLASRPEGGGRPRPGPSQGWWAFPVRGAVPGTRSTGAGRGLGSRDSHGTQLPHCAGALPWPAFPDRCANYLFTGHACFFVGAVGLSGSIEARLSRTAGTNSQPPYRHEPLGCERRR